MKLPNRLNNLLSQDDSLSGCIKTNLSEFEPWFRFSKMPLFPEYTDHGTDHIETVLLSADSIISDEAWAILTPSDCAVLILAALLHDSAMHISEEGFFSLISPNSRWNMETHDWFIQWNEFVRNAKRWDHRKLKNIFGSIEPINIPGSNSESLTRKDRLLIGEFIRTNHSNLAYAIALHGVPSPKDDLLKLICVDEYIAKISGIVAMSHGLHLRECFQYLQEYDLREFRGVHAVYLMVVLRISDYLQVQAERAPKQVLKITKLSSPLSQVEWKSHQAIRDIRNTHDDPEALYVDAMPDDVETFIKLKRLINGLQRELDSSWAVLGEVYGRISQLNNLGLLIRRVRSSIDDIKDFGKKVNYIPIHAKFNTSDVNVLNLLIGPLYDDNPCIGVRELMQNAVDAVLERCDLPGPKQQVGNNELSSIKVVLEKDKNGTPYLTVSDNGVGMNSEVIINYFLKAGASFRMSDAWRNIHEDEQGNSRVMRSGRFGVGVLAAFLLGDELYVSTRHINEPSEKGIEFSALLESDSVELRYIPREVGTTIRVKLTEKTYKKLNEGLRKTYYWEPDPTEDWDWYCLEFPCVTRYHAEDDKTLTQRHKLPSCNSDLPDGWHRIIHEDYADIQWTYEKSPPLTCNGIIVPKAHYSNKNFKVLWDNGHFRIKMPSLSVFDPNGNLPLNLQRISLNQSRLSFISNLREEILRDFMSHFLINAPQVGFSKSSVSQNFYMENYTGINSNYGQVGENILPFVYTNEGTTILDYWPLAQIGMARMIIVPVIGDKIKIPGVQINKTDVFCGLPINHDKLASQRWLKTVFSPVVDYGYRDKGIPGFEVVGSVVLLSRELAEEKNKPGKLVAEIRKHIKEIWKSKEWVVWGIGEPKIDDIDFREISENLSDMSSRTWPGIGLAIWNLKPKANDDDPSKLSKLWKEQVEFPIVPYGYSERKTRLSHAFKKLSPYIDYYEKNKSKEKE